jgi:hypothetical protein
MRSARRRAARSRCAGRAVVALELLDVGEREAYDLAAPQTRERHEVKDRAVALAQPAAPVGRPQQRVELRA